MKQHIKFLPILLLAAFAFVGTGCQDKCESVYTYTAFTPEYMSFDELRSAVTSESPRALNNPGKIYTKGNLLFINEVEQGIHVIDNSNPANPVNIAFINVPGAIDLAVKGNVMYADSYVDLLAIDISDVNNISVLKRIENVFPQYDPNTLQEIEPGTDGVVKSWTAVQITETLEDCGEWDAWNAQWGWQEDVFMPTTGTVLSPASVSSGGTGFDASGGGRNVDGAGLGGSMARFTIVSDFLYTVDRQDLHLFDISNNANPYEFSEMTVGADIETIFPYNNHLYMGSMSGLYIYNIANPASPQFTSTYWHITACDPVVVNGQWAYVTLRTGSPCTGWTDQLDVVDLNNINNPVLHSSYIMTNPHGLGIDGNTLFICDGNAGLKIYDASTPDNITDRLLAQHPSVQATDVIPLGGVLLMIGDDGLYQYDYTDVENIHLLSRIPVM